MKEVTNLQSNPEAVLQGYVFPPRFGFPPTHIPRDICSPKQKVFPQGKMFPPIGYMYSASGLKSKLFVFSVLWHILLSISSIKCHKRARLGENVAELLLIPYICINHIENESRYHIYSILYTRFFRQSAKSL